WSGWRPLDSRPSGPQAAREEEVEIHRARPPALRAHTAEPRLDALQIPEQLTGGQLRVEHADGVEEGRLLDLPHRRGVVERRNADQRSVGQRRQLVEGLANQRFPLAEIGAESDERSHARRPSTSITARPPVVQPRFCLAISTLTPRIGKFSRIRSATRAASVSSRWKLLCSTTSRTVRWSWS